MQLSTARSPAALDSLRSRWEHLFCHQQHTIFQSFAWNRLAAQVFGDRASPYVVYAESSSGAALIPAAIAGGTITLLGEALFDYRDVLVAGDGEALTAAWRELARLGLPFAVTAVRGAALHWPGFELRPFSDAPYISAAQQNGDQFAAAHNRTGRFVRRLSRNGAELKCYPGSASAMVADVYRRKARQPIGKNLFSDARRSEFMVAAAALDSSAVNVHTFESGGSLVGALVTLRDGDVRRFYTTWFDQAWAHNSPGTALLFEVSRQSLAEGLDCDYMTGTQSHKLRFATGSVPLFQAEASAEHLSRTAGERVQLVA